MPSRKARTSAIILIAVSGLLLLGALGFQYLGGLPPCEMCYWQRYAHVVVMVIAVAAFALDSRAVCWLAIGAMLAASALGFYHAGVEQHYWEGVTSCASSMRAGMSQDEILSNILASPMVRCDQVPWKFLDLSMACWNGIISLFAATTAAFALRR